MLATVIDFFSVFIDPLMVTFLPAIVAIFAMLVLFAMAWSCISMIAALRLAAQARSRLFQPSVVAEAQYLRLASYNHFEDYFRRFKENDFSIAVSISVPVWAGGRTREMAAEARRRHVGSEHADLQGESAPQVFVASGRWADVRDHRDLAGRPRYLTARLAR